jgi:hypothetical protein
VTKSLWGGFRTGEPGTKVKLMGKNTLTVNQWLKNFQMTKKNEPEIRFRNESFRL